MPIQIGQKPSPTFQQPLELLSDCHRRIEAFLGSLVLVSERARGGTLGSLEREALETALRYFREAAPKHIEDEEESLFPRLRQSADDLARRALEPIATLEADHEAVRLDHHAVEELGRKWLALDHLAEEELTRLSGHLRRLQTIYERHIAFEDRELFPVAARVLDATALAEVGREMARRRGRPPG